MNRLHTDESMPAPCRARRSWFSRRRQHDALLVLNLSVFNSGSSWNRIFNPVTQSENVWF